MYCHEWQFITPWSLSAAKFTKLNKKKKKLFLWESHQGFCTAFELWRHRSWTCKCKAIKVYVVLVTCACYVYNYKVTDGTREWNKIILKRGELVHDSKLTKLMHACYPLPQHRDFGIPGIKKEDSFKNSERWNKLVVTSCLPQERRRNTISNFCWSIACWNFL